MSYHDLKRRQSLGIDAAEALSRAKSLIKAGTNILEDPALPRVTQLILKLNEIEQRKPAPKPVPKPAPKPGQKPAPKPTAPAKPKVPGIGLSTVVKPLEFYVYTQENSWVIPVAVLGLLAVPFLLGYKVARRRR